MAIFVVVASITIDRAFAQSVSGMTVRQLQEHCTVFARSRGTWQGIACVSVIIGFRGGYAAGVYDADQLSGGNGSNPRKGICTPSGVTNEQVAALFARWATRNPKHWHRDAALGVWAALRETWPCR